MLNKNTLQIIIDSWVSMVMLTIARTARKFSVAKLWLNFLYEFFYKKITVAVIFSISLLVAGGAYAAEVRIFNSDFIGCADREYYEKAMSYLVHSDDEAFTRKLLAGLLTGECVVFELGDEVFILDTAAFSGVDLAKVRKRGSIIEYWVDFDVLKRKY